MCERCDKNKPVTHLVESDLLRMFVCQECAEEAFRLLDTEFENGKLKLQPIYKDTQIY